MTEATQTADSTEARQASMSRVQTQETVLAKLVPTEAAKVPPEGKPEGEQGKDEGESKTKKSASERIQELATKRREAEAKADAAERRAADLEARLQALSVQAKPMDAQAKPMRSQFGTDDDYIEALSDWKAKDAIAKRETEQAQARAEAEQVEIAAQWSKRQEKFMKTFPDYAEIIGKSEVQIPNVIHEAMLESEQGPHVAVYLAMHPEEAKRLSEMKPVAAIKRFRDLERDLAEIDAEDEPKPKAEEVKETPPPKKSKAPPPIEPVKSAPSSSGSSASNYEEYKRRRQAGS